jgi:hypothetical protein
MFGLSRVPDDLLSSFRISRHPRQRERDEYRVNSNVAPKFHFRALVLLPVVPSAKRHGPNIIWPLSLADRALGSSWGASPNVRSLR